MREIGACEIKRIVRAEEVGEPPRELLGEGEVVRAEHERDEAERAERDLEERDLNLERVLLDVRSRQVADEILRRQ